MEKKGKLFLCATPIGNLDDITLRAAKALRAAPLVAAEDTRHTRKLLNHLGAEGKLFGYHEHNKDAAGPILLDKLREGADIVLVSDAGYPGIADPGEALVVMAIAEGIEVVPLPGANAVLTALVASGLPTTPFFFGGFLPKTKKHRREKLEDWKDMPHTIIFYEAPHRIKDVLRDIREGWGDRKIVLARELTKLYEEFFRGTVTEALTWLDVKPPRGEFTLVIGGADVQLAAEPNISALEAASRLIAEGSDKKETIKQIAKKYGISKRQLYQELLQESSQKI